MAARSFLFNLKQTRYTTINNCNRGSGSFPCSRFLSSGALKSEFFEDSSNSQEKNDLRSRIFSLRLPKRSAINVIHRWVSEGNQTNILELRQILKDLRNSQLMKSAPRVSSGATFVPEEWPGRVMQGGMCLAVIGAGHRLGALSERKLQISEWIVTHEEFVTSDSDYAARIDLMTKVFGIDAAERYFEGLPASAKTSETYTALLHSYAGAKFTDKAEELYKRIKESNLSFNALTYNEMMTLYMSVGQVEKVALVVEELKRQKVAPDIFTYNLWISSCAATLNIDEVRNILDEMSRDSGSNDGWLRYINLVKIYITAGHLVNSDASPLVEAEKSISQREWITYDFLIILYAGLENKDKIDQIWKSLRMTKQNMTSRNYICILSSYLMLGHLKEMEEVIDQWKQSTTSDFDTSACNRLLGSFVEIGLTEKANDLQMLLLQKNCIPTNDST
ncbi:hypothetical protein EZV62_019242 [Acer yangbiense]|uniref:Pentacotripeptide-repeat region of PRORP domain-containing protein n=1 Tax=Acer yangbiense TaxID=1000413 RepID=A0A5C7HCS4_9ROSI|nr:hypothetical protein EZV62_019242 [Acer yangbiense]